MTPEALHKLAPLLEASYANIEAVAALPWGEALVTILRGLEGDERVTALGTALDVVYRLGRSPFGVLGILAREQPHPGSDNRLYWATFELATVIEERLRAAGMVPLGTQLSQAPIGLVS